MPFVDIIWVLRWWFSLFIIGTVFLPITLVIFSNFLDKGYIFSKILGSIVVSYVVFLLGSLHIVPFTQFSAVSILALALFLNITIYKRFNLLSSIKKLFKFFIFEEILFFVGILLWSIVRSYQPDIQGLEKFMDFGFVNSILRAKYFPPNDMWFTPYPINYYYFGHLITAVLTKLSGISSSITYNLMLATLFSFTFTCSFSIAANLMYQVQGQNLKFKIITDKLKVLFAGLLTGILVAFSGNLHTIYTFFFAYPNENPVPPWQLVLSPQTFPNAYWYPNATRFIHNTIHEFPLYSFVVSDLHGHVLGIPIVLTIIAMLAHEFTRIQTIDMKKALLLSFLLAVAYMTNAWDGIIYALLTFLVFTYLAYRSKKYLLFTIYYLLSIATAIIISLPFSIHFKPFVSGIGVLCAPKFLTDIGKLGPFLFEADHCQHSPFWQLIILYGFFYFFVLSFLIFLWRKLKSKHHTLYTIDIFILLLITLSTLLIITPEFIYIKDIYPAHYRANTMFKLVYESFIMLSICSGYIIVRVISNKQKEIRKIYLLPFWILIAFLLSLISIYPFFAIPSYYADLKIYKGLDGMTFLKRLYPDDYQAILWLNKNVKDQSVILEAQGDSYTDYGRVSANTGLPTVLGWTVHEWLWRGTYDIPAPRISEVQTLYETNNIETTKELFKKHNISLVFVGDLERKKYTNLNEEKFQSLGKLLYQNGQTKIYQIK